MQVHGHKTDNESANTHAPVLAFAIRNNDVPVAGMVHQVLVLDTQLNPFSELLLKKRTSEANDMAAGQGVEFFVDLDGFSLTPFIASSGIVFAYVVYEIKYTNALTGGPHSQVWFLRLAGQSVTTGLPGVFGASADERELMGVYLRQRNVPMLTPLN